MRIGLVSGEYPPMQGGVGAFTQEIAYEFVAQGHHAFVYTRSDASLNTTSNVKIKGEVHSNWGWKTNRSIRNWASSNRLDVINVQYQTAAFDMHPAVHRLPSVVSKCPVIVTFHDLREPYLFPKAHWLGLRQYAVKYLARSADGVISTDRMDENKLIDSWNVSAVTRIPIGSNISVKLPKNYERDDWRSSLGVETEDLLISYFGFLNKSKGGIVLIQALAELVKEGVPAHLVMIGGRAGASDPTNVSYGKHVDAAIVEYDLSNRIQWTGFVTDEEVSANLIASDITALPYLDGASLRRGTLMAALAHERAIVTSDPVLAIPEIDDAVVTVPPNDPGALATAILSLWRNKPRRGVLEEAAGKAAEHFTWAQIAEQTLNFYSSILTKFHES